MGESEKTHSFMPVIMMGMNWVSENNLIPGILEMAFECHVQQSLRRRKSPVSMACIEKNETFFPLKVH